MSERKIVDYKILTDESIEKLSQQICFMSERNYILHGAPYEVKYYDNKWLINQAMVKYEETT